MIELILADDHAMLREGLRRKFEDCSDISIVGETGNASELQHLLSLHPTATVILDIKLPDKTGLQILPQLKADFPRCKIVILTMFNHVRYLLESLSAGAEAFLVKGAPFEELEHAVREVAEGRTYVCTEMAPHLIQRVKRPEGNTLVDSLSSREFEVLTLLSSGLGPKDAGKRLGISEKTVSTYRQRLLEKLKLDSTSDLIRFAVEMGIIG